MQLEFGVIDVGVFEDVVDPRGVEQRCPAFDPVDLIAFLEKELSEI